MRRVFVLLTALGLIVVAGAAGTAGTEAQEPPQGVKVRGEGLVQAPPDIATLGIGVSVRRETPAAAFSRAEDQAEALRRIFEMNGVAPADVRTTAVSLGPEMVFEQGTSRIVGWRAGRTFSVRMRDFSRIAAMLDAAVTLLGQDANIQGITFSREDTDALISRARAEAFANARAAAEELARQAGMTLGDVIAMEETSTPSPTPVQAMPQAMAAAPTPRPSPAPGSPSASTFEPGTISVRVFVVVVFELIKPARP